MEGGEGVVHRQSKQTKRCKQVEMKHTSGSSVLTQQNLIIQGQKGSSQEAKKQNSPKKKPPGEAPPPQGDETWA